MNKIENIIKYLCKNYPHKNELSKARLTKLVYLADWFSALTKNKQMTNIEWVFNHYGPYVDEITSVATRSDDFNYRSYRKLILDAHSLVDKINSRS